MILVNYAFLRRDRINTYIANPKIQKLLYVRGLFGVIGLNCAYFGLSKLPFAEATVIIFSSPIWSGVLG